MAMLVLKVVDTCVKGYFAPHNDKEAYWQDMWAAISFYTHGNQNIAQRNNSTGMLSCLSSFLPEVHLGSYLWLLPSRGLRLS